jgi:hypothetical protein
MQLQKITLFFSKLFQSLLSIVKIVLLSKWVVKFKKHRAKENECVILANGPCLTKDLELHSSFIAERKKFCVNLFAFSDEYEKVKPDYYILVAPEFYMKAPIEFHVNQRTKLTKDIFEKTSWSLKLFIPYAGRNSELVSKLKTNEKIEIVFFNPTPLEGFNSIINFLCKLSLGMPRPHNVLVPSIFLAINLGFKKIILFGADHSWHEGINVDESNIMTVNHEHFYDKKEVRMPMYKLDGKKYFLHDVFRKLHLAFKGYFVLKNYADYIGAKIQNASSKSYIDAFEKINI